MRRIKTVVGVVAVMAAMLVVFAAPALAQDFSSDFEQEADSGDVDQSFVVTNTGDNSNQCVGLQGVANTGNAQDQTSLFQIGSDADDFDFDHGGSNIDMSPTNTTTCDQEVNQAATAYDGGGGYDYDYNYNYYYYYYY
jgi:hypothetical protein